MSKNIFEGLDSVLSKNEDGEILIDTDVDYSKVDPIGTKKEEDKKEDDKNPKEEDKNLIEIPDGKTEEVKEDKEEEIKDEPQEVNVFKTLATVLKEEGVLPTLDIEKFEGKPEELIAGIQAEIKDGIEGFKESLHPAIKELQEKYEEGVPLDELIGIKSEQMRFDNLDENEIKEDIELQKNLVAYHLSQTTKWNEAKIKKEVERLSDVEELEAEAFDAHKELKKIAVQAEKELIAKAKIDEAKRLKDAKDTNDKIEKAVTGVTEIIPGIKVTEKEKQGLLRSLTKPVAFDDDNKPVSKAMQKRKEDPIKFELMLNYFIDRGFFDGKFDTIMTKAKSDSLKQLEEQARSIVPKVGKTNISSNSTGADLLQAYKSTKK